MKGQGPRGMPKRHKSDPALLVMDGPVIKPGTANHELPSVSSNQRVRQRPDEAAPRGSFHIDHRAIGSIVTEKINVPT